MPRVDTDTFYRNALARYGHNAQGAHWESVRSQQVRFGVLRRLLPADLSTLTLVDMGCGLGDLFEYLTILGACPGEYLGIDVVEPMVEIARRRTGREILLLDALRDPLPEADYYLCSGAMNTLTREETGCFIERCFAASREGFVFNLLRGADDCHTFNYWEPEEIEALALVLEADCTIETDYLYQDFSVALRHRVAGGGEIG
ncbi:class I SAM-dependent methyltransferase [uncultured Thiodictyon sp.]|uniref:class I SAM-dependent methyltransferase n=1 Tax=uncultured Thiodictyon sp. TaxID=1846217 RepID=UPI0025CFF82C|nr:class I SAM-dependent methyltransferase [uncultured Thiodictyon sp.]